MKRLLWWVGIGLLVLVACCFRSPTQAAEAPPPDQGGEVLAVFAMKCAGCHSPAAREIKGNFNYVLDLKKLRADENKVVPGHPDESNLFRLVNAGNMPPNGSPTGPLLVGQRETIRGWIVAGSPAPIPGGLTPPVPGAGLQPPLPALWVSTPEESFAAHLWRWTGETHLLLLHFPVVCVLAAVLAEVLGACRRLLGMETVVVYCLVVGALAAVPTVACGWVYAASGHGSGQPGTLLWHRVLGTTGGVLLGLLALVASAPALLGLPLVGARGWWFLVARRVLLVLTAGMILATAHLGGKMAFGEAFLWW